MQGKQPNDGRFDWLGYRVADVSYHSRAADWPVRESRQVLFSSFRLFAPLLRIKRKQPRTADLFEHIRKQLPGFEMRIAFDVGANVGQTLAVLIRNAPLADVYSFEPVTAAYRKLATLAEGRSNIHCVHAALGALPGSITVSSIGTKTSNRAVSVQRRGQSEEVAMLTGDGFCAEQGIHGISYLKIDTEGHDLNVLNGFRGTLEIGGIDLIEIEAGINPENTWHVPVHEFIAFLCPLGYRIFQFYEQRFERTEPVLRRVNAVFISSRLASRFSRK